MTYIALLRGINVGGHNVKMDRLRSLFTELGLSNVRTFIQSGNVFFDSDETDLAILQGRIEQHLEKALGYTVPTFLRTITQIEAIMANDPFKGLDVTSDMRLCIVFTAQPIPDKMALPMTSSKQDVAIIGANEHEAFVVWHIIDGRPPAATTLDKVLGKTTTTRFFHTMAKILAAAKSA